MRGQISIEYTLLIGILLIITIPLFFYAVSQTNSEIKIQKAAGAVESIANTADSIYSLGPGSKKYIWVNIPAGITSTKINGNDISISISIFEGVSEIHSYTNADLEGTLPIKEGLYKISIEALSSGKVRVGYGAVITDCGNDIKEGIEECDGTDLDGETCESLGYEGGTLSCAVTCTFDTTGCVGHVCGNDVREGDEICDGTDLDGETCESLGYGGGILNCETNCLSFDTTGCEQTYIDASFDSGQDGFSYSDDMFRGTHQPSYSSGNWDGINGHTGLGSLRTKIGDVNSYDIWGMSGGWSESFTLTTSEQVSVTLWYRILLQRDYESDECGEVLAAIDSTLYGSIPHDYVERYCGGTGSDQDSGWVQFSFTSNSLDAGEHTLEIGGYNNKKTYSNEYMEIWIDDITVTNA